MRNLHARLVKEINARCVRSRLQIVDYVGRSKSWKKRLYVDWFKRWIIINNVSNKQQQQQQQRCATNEGIYIRRQYYGKGHDNDGLAALEQRRRRQLKQEARGDERVEERATVRSVSIHQWQIIIITTTTMANVGGWVIVGPRRGRKRKRKSDI